MYASTATLTYRCLRSIENRARMTGEFSITVANSGTRAASSARNSLISVVSITTPPMLMALPRMPYANLLSPVTVPVRPSAIEIRYSCSNSILDVLTAAISRSNGSTSDGRKGLETSRR